MNSPSQMIRRIKVYDFQRFDRERDTFALLAIGKNSVSLPPSLNVILPFFSRSEQESTAADREGLILPSIKSSNTGSIRETPNTGSIREYKSGAQQATSPLQATAKPRRAGRPKGEVEVPSGLFDGYLESTSYNFSNLGELIYMQKGLSPLVKWKSLNDELNNVLKAQYAPEGGGVAITAPPYTQGPATLPPQRLKVIDTAEQLIFTLGLREGNRILKYVRKLDVSGHQIPCVPDHIGHISALTSLNFSCNRLQVREWNTPLECASDRVHIAGLITENMHTLA